ncbi:MAG: glycosyltransferase [Spirochaetia bacterium]
MIETHRLDSLRSRKFFQLSDFQEGFYERARRPDQWRVLADRFDEYERKKGDRAATQIPKRIHQIWLGGGLPERYRAWTDSWRRVNTGWEYRLWDEKSILQFGLRNEAAFRKSASFGARSDIARYEILEREGGVYADTDFECLRPLDELAVHCSFFAGTLFDDVPEISNGLLGSAPGHPLLRLLIAQLSEPIATKDTGVILDSSGPRFLTRIFFANLAFATAWDVIFPSTYFFPFPNFFRREFVPFQTMRGYARDWSLAIHYWETAWARPHPVRIFLSRAKRRLLGQPIPRI